MAWNWRRRNQDQDSQNKGIEEIAHAVYLNRTQLSKPGDAQTDWETARKIASNPLKKLLFVSKQPAEKSLKFVAWDVPRWFLFSVPQLKWMKLIAVPLVLAAAGSIISSQIQRESNQITALKQYFDQLERLTFDQKLLDDKPNTGAIVIARGRTVASLRELDTKRKRQLLAFLQASELLQSNDPTKEPIISFRAANLSEIDLSNADLSETDLQRAVLSRANLQGANLESANLERAVIMTANLQGAGLLSTNLQGALLISANLERASLSSANLQGAVLINANLKGAFLLNTNLKGANGVNQKQLSQAFLCHTILPDGIDLDPDRDCDRFLMFQYQPPGKG